MTAICLALPMVTAILGIAVTVSYKPHSAFVWLIFEGASFIAGVYLFESGNEVIFVLVVLEAVVNTPITLGVLMAASWNLSDPNH